MNATIVNHGNQIPCDTAGKRGTKPIRLPVTPRTALLNLLSSGVKHPFCDILTKLKTIPFNCIWAAKEVAVLVTSHNYLKGDSVSAKEISVNFFQLTKLVMPHCTELNESHLPGYSPRGGGWAVLELNGTKLVGLLLRLNG